MIEAIVFCRTYLLGCTNILLRPIRSLTGHYQRSIIKKLSVLAAIPIWAVGVFGQTLSFSVPPTEYSNIQVGGQLYGMGGVGTAIWNNRLYVAYTQNNYQGGTLLTYTSDGVNFSPSTIVPVGGATGFSASNPALTVFNNQLYIAFVDQYNIPVYTSTSDGVTFAALHAACSTTATASPGMVAYKNNLYMGYMTASGHNLALCNITPPQKNPAPYATVYSNISLGDSPSLAVFNNTLYIAYRNDSGNHYLYLATSTDGINLTLSNAANSSHTSTAPSIAIHNGILYIMFRQNSSGDHLYYTYSTDGVNFSGPIYVGITMGGPPSATTATFNCCSTLNGNLFVVFRQNDTGHYLFTTHSP